ncbi:MAG: EAL domain-containing protein, partial [Actinomycetes bacterium]
QNLDIAYQPVISIRTGKIVALEAFARWTTASGAAVSPDVFIPMAEESGMIGELGAQILRKATRAAARWQSIAPTALRVNVSAREVEAPGFYDDVMRTLGHADLEPRLLGLELSEPRLFAEGSRSAQNLSRLRVAGVSVLLGDYGVGAAPADAGQVLPSVDVLKIDRAVISAADADVLLPQTVDLAKAGGIHVSAAGIEDANQHMLVADLGCDYAQGYFFARPIAGSLVPKMLGSWAPFLPARPQL